MTLEDFYGALKDLAALHAKKDTRIRIDYKKDSDLIRVFGEGATALARARCGLGDVQELSYDAAEHHPFWNMLYCCSEISQTILEKWEGRLTREELDEIRWSIDELKNSLANLQKNRE